MKNQRSALTCTLAYSDGMIVATSYDSTTSDGDMENAEWRNEGVKVWTQHGVLLVTGLTSGIPWRIYNLYGQWIYAGIADGNNAEIRLSVKGLFIVQSGNGTMKIMVNN